MQRCVVRYVVAAWEVFKQEFVLFRIFDPRIGREKLLETGGVCVASPLPANTPIRREIVDALFEFSHTLAYNYTGQWISACTGPTLAESCSRNQNRQFVITVTALDPDDQSCSPTIEGCPLSDLDTPSVGYPPHRSKPLRAPSAAIVSRTPTHHPSLTSSTPLLPSPPPFFPSSLSALTGTSTATTRQADLT